MFSSFELLGFLFKDQHHILCILIYRPSRANAGIIQDLSDLYIMAKFDRVLFFGGFNLYVCCPSTSAFTADFINIFECFNLKQSVKSPTHSEGHTLDPVLSQGVSLKNMELLDFNVSDHKTVTFHTLLPLSAHRSTTFIHPRSASSFCNKFLATFAHNTTNQNGLSIILWKILTVRVGLSLVTWPILMWNFQNLRPYSG